MRPADIKLKRELMAAMCSSLLSERPFPAGDAQRAHLPPLRRAWRCPSGDTRSPPCSERGGRAVQMESASSRSFTSTEPEKHSFPGRCRSARPWQTQQSARYSLRSQLTPTPALLTARSASFSEKALVQFVRASWLSKRPPCSSSVRRNRLQGGCLSGRISWNYQAFHCTRNAQ